MSWWLHVSLVSTLTFSGSILWSSFILTWSVYEDWNCCRKWSFAALLTETSTGWRWLVHWAGAKMQKMWLLSRMSIISRVVGFRSVYCGNDKLPLDSKYGSTRGNYCAMKCLHMCGEIRKRKCNLSAVQCFHDLWLCTTAVTFTKSRLLCSLGNNYYYVTDSRILVTITVLSPMPCTQPLVSERIALGGLNTLPVTFQSVKTSVHYQIATFIPIKVP